MSYNSLSTVDIKVMLATVRVHRRDGRCTVRTVATEAGVSVSTAHKSLAVLRRLQLVLWDDGKQGTLRPLAEVVS